MKKSWAMKWVKALRSGKYKQGKEYLKREDRYCCLGVLCELTGNKFVKMDWYDKENVYYIKKSKGNEETTLSPSIMKKVGMCSDKGDNYNLDSNHSSLVDMNDSGKSFKQIANYIKKHWKDL